jgi:RNA 3'-terminal phosphate cyclase (ATP)
MSALTSVQSVEIDGSQSGGKLLRRALALALITGTPFELHQFRRQTLVPGLRPADLAYLRAIQLISSSEIRGVELGSQSIRVEPGELRAGPYELDIGAAASVPRLIETLACALALKGGGDLSLRGTTHPLRGPSYHWLTWVWRPALQALGLDLSLTLRQSGFHPEAGGEVHLELRRWSSGPERIDLPARGTLKSAVVTAVFAGVPLALAQRQARAAVDAMREHGILCEEEHLPLPTGSAGSALFLRLQFEHTAAGFSAVADRPSPAEVVGDTVSAAVAAFMASGGSIDAELADQLLVPCAVLASGRLGMPAYARFRAPEKTEALERAAQLIEQFLPVRVAVSTDATVEIQRQITSP